MGEAIPKGVKDLWDKWNIRGLVILSLVLQTILVLLSPNRKRTHRWFFQFLIWSAYLLANWAAEYAVGQIAESQGEEPQPKNNDLLAFWATFLLLHLGGPDTITALALEDNNLWLRSLFGLVCQAIITLYVFLLSIPNNLLVPTSLMLVAGVIKYVERIKALRGASLENFKDSMLEEPNPGPDYARLMEEYSIRKILREPTQIVRIEEAEKGQRPEDFVRPKRKLTDLEVVQYAYKYFNIFKGLVVDLIFSSQSEQWNNSKAFFLASKSEDALRILEVELSFIYGTFYTKVDILHTRIGVAFRFLALVSEVSDRAESVSEIHSARGEWVLRNASVEKARNRPERLKLLLPYVTQVDYDQSILVWHIATELLYHTDGGNETNHSEREFSKMLSDYMMYLLIVQPALMSSVAGIDKIKFREAIAKAKKFTEAKKFLVTKKLEGSRNAKEVCEEILSSLEVVKERGGKRYQRKDVLADSKILANALKQLTGVGEDETEEVMWEVMSKVWVEMLCYAASHCDPKQHVAQLSGGGEFLSFVWLLMAHFGLGDHFQTTEENARAKMIVTR
ncbi:unnamed protein product [Microthlaspi erraticum]|uniref:DUF4220 domain-containing protein n=1 Tax=Microthlaspi erraticum TaxID=1685480 RepID=A0A6D2J1Y9_9BRAS|nr:unnamed protein product [Microthlaspi erraticum]